MRVLWFLKKVWSGIRKIVSLYFIHYLLYTLHFRKTRTLFPVLMQFWKIVGPRERSEVEKLIMGALIVGGERVNPQFLKERKIQFSSCLINLFVPHNPGYFAGYFQRWIGPREFSAKEFVKIFKKLKRVPSIFENSPTQFLLNIATQFLLNIEVFLLLCSSRFLFSGFCAIIFPGDPERQSV